METKICTKCKQELPLSQFYFKDKEKKRYASHCKKCHNEYVKMIYHQKHNDIEQLKALCSCEKCGEKRGYVLDFHHKNPQEKDNTISKMISQNLKLETIKQEIDKCIVLCANCHREFHYLEKNNNISIQEYLKKDANITYSNLISSQTDDDISIKWKQKGQEKQKKYCIDCGKEISRNAIRCSQCANKNQQTIINKISRDQLKNKIRTMSFISIGKEYNVTDNAIRKWCDRFNLPRTKKEINSYSDEEWNNI